MRVVRWNTVVRLFVLAMLLISCSRPNQESSVIATVPASSVVEPTATAGIVPTETSSVEFEIVEAEIIPEGDLTYKDYLRPGVNVKVVLSNLDPGYLPENQLLPSNFCGFCVGWDNAGIEDGYNAVILHFYSWDLVAGENMISISAFGIRRHVSVIWTPPVTDPSATSIPNPLGEFEIVSATPVTSDHTAFQSYLRPGINIRVVLANLDPGLMPEDQLKPAYFCQTCNGWDNAGSEGGYFVVVLHFSSSSMSPGDNIITITGYGVTKEASINYDPSIHLIK